MFDTSTKLAHMSTVYTTVVNCKLHYTTLHSFNSLFSRTTRVSRHQKSRTILVQPISIYWRKRQWVAVATA